MVVQVDTSGYVIDHTIKSFVVDEAQLESALPEDKFINISERNIIYKETTIPPNAFSLFKITVQLS